MRPEVKKRMSDAKPKTRPMNPAAACALAAGIVVACTLAGYLSRPLFSETDVIMFYLRGPSSAYYRMQRDKYATEYAVCTFPSPVTRITRVGLGRDLRMQVEVELT